MRHNNANIPVSVAIITKNEADRIEECIKSAQLADEIVVVDSGSTDDTVGRAISLGCKVFEEDWKGYALQKQSAIDKCVNEWVLVLDADERVPLPTWEAISRALAEFGGKIDAFALPRQNFFNGRPLKYGYEWPDKVTRLVNKTKARMDESVVHEDVIAANVMHINAPLLHYKRFAMNDYLTKLNTYSTLLAQKTLLRNPDKKTSVANAFFSFLAHFCRSYFLCRAVLDGSGGFIISFTEALHSFYKQIKILEMQGKIRN